MTGRSWANGSTARLRQQRLQHHRETADRLGRTAGSGLGAARHVAPEANKGQLVDSDRPPRAGLQGRCDSASSPDMIAAKIRSGGGRSGARLGSHGLLTSTASCQRVCVRRRIAESDKDGPIGGMDSRTARKWFSSAGRR